MSRLISANPMFWRRRGGQTQAVISPVLSDKGCCQTNESSHQIASAA